MTISREAPKVTIFFDDLERKDLTLLQVGRFPGADDRPLSAASPAARR